VNASKLLIQSYLDGDLTDEQSQDLARWLKQDPAHIEEFLLTCQLHSQLRDNLGPLELAGNLSAAASLAAKPKVSATAAKPRRWRAWLGNLVDWRGHPVQFGMFGITITLLGWFLLFSWILPWRGDRPPHLADGPRTTEQVVARVTGVADTVWEEGAHGWIVGAGLHAGRQLQLASGLVEIEFLDGSSVILEGPCEATVESRNSGRLVAGRLTARVPHEAIGFRIETESATIVDLGTEFGVAASGSEENAETEVQVFDGSVEVDFGPGGEKQVLTAGQSARVRLADLQLVAAREESFRRALPPPSRVFTTSVRTGKAVGTKLNYGQSFTPRVPGDGAPLRTVDPDQVLLTAFTLFAGPGNSHGDLYLNIYDGFVNSNGAGPGKFVASSVNSVSLKGHSEGDPLRWTFADVPLDYATRTRYYAVLSTTKIAGDITKSGQRMATWNKSGSGVKYAGGGALFRDTENPADDEERERNDLNFVAEFRVPAATEAANDK
jgi:ferric-dicitrate binding protein FerR (iron transport regulator)